MKRIYCDTVTGRVFEAEPGRHAEGLLVKEGGGWVPTVPLQLPAGMPPLPELPVEAKKRSASEILGWTALILGAAGGLLSLTPAFPFGMILLVCAALSGVAALPCNDKDTPAETAPAQQARADVPSAPERPMAGWVAVGWCLAGLAVILAMAQQFLLAASMAGTAVFVLLISHAARAIAEAKTGAKGQED